MCASDASGTWEVENYGGGSYGTMTLDQATTNSVNTVYAQLISEVGPERVKDMLEKLGFAPKYGEEEIEAMCSQALGGALDVTPLEQARAYAAMANQGVLPTVTPVLYITDSEGDCIVEFVERKGDCEKDYKEPEEVDRVVSANVAERPHRIVDPRRRKWNRDRGEHRQAGRRQDGNVAGEPRRLVRRLHDRTDHRSVGRLSTRPGPGWKERYGGRRRCVHALLRRYPRPANR